LSLLVAKKQGKNQHQQSKKFLQKIFKKIMIFFSFINVIETSGLFLYFRIRAIAKKKENSSICFYKNIQSSPTLISLEKQPSCF